MKKDKKVVTIEEVIAKAKQKNSKIDDAKIMKAYEFANKQHENQLRKSGEPYIIHPLEVANILAELEMDEDTICAALLHDVVEDTPVTIEDINKLFGESVAEMVAGVTKLNTLSYTSAQEQQVEDYRKMFLAMGKDIRVILIKLADRLHNMRTLKYLSRDRQIANAKETMDLYAPLANRLGIYTLKWELEDLSFRYLYPEEFFEIVQGLDKKREERLKFLDKIVQNVKDGLRKENIEFEIEGRAKHLYSIYRKMLRDNKTLDEIYDLFAIRILVNSVKDCYAALGVVHELYSPMPGRFKDYIAVPKPNMYQSIHTTLIGPNATPFEVQIRTWDMHRIAEFGIAAHWAYKEANKTKKSNVTVKDDKLAWLRETLEWQKDTLDPDEFLKTLKTELFEDEVYVFTPKGDIKVLPKGSTPIDLAYTIHAEIGNKMVGAKINGKMMPILTQLNNGDIVEILTSDNAKGPSRDWIKFVKSSSAKNKIQQFFKKALREENIVKGKEAIEKEIKRLGLSHAELFKPQFVQAALDRYKYANLDDLYASIGFGAISQTKIISRMLEEYNKEHKEEQIEEKLEELVHTRPSNAKPSKTGVIVKGIDNCLVRLSKCCNPLPGDAIVGYITKGRGVSVHRADCINAKQLVSEENRMIDVSWYIQGKSKYNVGVEVLANDRKGLLSDVIKKIDDTKALLMGVNTKTTREKVAILDIALEVESLEELNKAIKSLKLVDSVFEVRRKNEKKQ
ncbi:MAG: bifunctional (p)ppGpp synthetase/guanosine-3',5'-bis(diphosphate) 3'-pyrophosphohydrolase [Clostridia bacterium]|nr:bifunctional (p)ppGpp synthetase/guanosine-3',5'-bis(diphosphate) 3'-pyrophosphohydrolase [Clostridia bacterium]